MGGRRQRGKIPAAPLLRADDQGGDPRRSRRLRQGLLRGVRHPRAERQCPSHGLSLSVLGHSPLVRNITVVPAKAGTYQSAPEMVDKWVPAFAGTTALVTAAPLRWKAQ